MGLSTTWSEAYLCKLTQGTPFTTVVRENSFIFRAQNPNSPLCCTEPQHMPSYGSQVDTRTQDICTMSWLSLQNCECGL